MNPMTNVKNIQKLNERMLDMGVADNISWHKQYKDSAYIFIGGLPYDLTEGDILCVFSQYGEIVNINLVREKKTGKQKGFCFLCYEDQRSTILAVDNFNGTKLGGRTIRVDHCADYRRPKGDEKDDDGKRKEIIEEGCAPKTPSPSPSEDEEEEPLEPVKKKKKIKKEKKHKKHKESRHKKDSSSESGSEEDKNDKNHKGKDGKVIKTETSSNRDFSSERASKSPKDSHQKCRDKHSPTSSKTREWDLGKRDDTRGISPRTNEREWDYGKRKRDDKRDIRTNEREWDDRKSNKGNTRDVREEQRHTNRHDSSSENRMKKRDYNSYDYNSYDYHKDQQYSQHNQYYDDHKRDRKSDDYRERDRRDRK